MYDKQYLIVIEKPHYPSSMMIPNKEIAESIYGNIVNTDGMPTKAYIAEVIEWREVK